LSRVAKGSSLLYEWVWNSGDCMLRWYSRICCSGVCVFFVLCYSFYVLFCCITGD
jgi:hypothetical protein